MIFIGVVFLSGSLQSHEGVSQLFLIADSLIKFEQGIILTF